MGLTINNIDEVPEPPQVDCGEQLQMAAEQLATLAHDVRRQTAALAYFKTALDTIRLSTTDNNLDRMPFVSFNFIDADGKVSAYKLDTAALPVEMRHTLIPLFETLLNYVKYTLVSDWRTAKQAAGLAEDAILLQ